MAFSDRDWSSELGGTHWAVLGTYPERWADLVVHPTLGPDVQHLLLDHAERHTAEQARLKAAYPLGDDPESAAPLTSAIPAAPLDENLLRACLPALCLPEFTRLPQTSVTLRRTLHHIAGRVRNNPRLITIAAEQLHTAASDLVRPSRLLALPDRRDNDYGFEHRIVDLAEDLALLSATPNTSPEPLDCSGRWTSRPSSSPHRSPEPPPALAPTGRQSSWSATPNTGAPMPW
ncbi:hypothetical protein ACFQ71_41060 [Streptomyces sp. NPDC056534]|uniref:hypothetical protein n=1 Tax=Streptomyces sp. NPDC056534 TaxID=3345857 RepID=UPI003681F7E4